MLCLVRERGAPNPGLASLDCSALERLGWLPGCSPRVQKPPGSKGLSNTPRSGTAMVVRSVDKNPLCCALDSSFVDELGRLMLESL
jgi:hypothetical protein